MGKRGPKSRSAEKRAREGHGTPTSDAFAGTEGNCPDYLNGYAAERFAFWWDQLKRVGRHATVDVSQLASLCEVESDERDLRRRIKREGRVLTRSGNRYTSPAVKQLNSTLLMKRGLLRDLCLSPKERKTFVGPAMLPDAPDDPMKVFEAGRPGNEPPPGMRISHG